MFYLCDEPMKKNIAFICPTCPTRAQLAYAWANQLLGPRYNYYIIALHDERVNKGSLLDKILEENSLDIDKRGHTFKGPPSVEIDIAFELSSLAKEPIPKFKGKKNIHVGLDNPDEISQGKSREE